MSSDAKGDAAEDVAVRDSGEEAVEAIVKDAERGEDIESRERRGAQYRDDLDHSIFDAELSGQSFHFRYLARLLGWMRPYLGLALASGALVVVASVLAVLGPVVISRVVIDGILLPTSRLGEVEAEPGQQLNLPPTAVFDAGNAVISFQPVDGAPIEEFTEGRHQARVIFWKIEDGRDYARSYTWTFDVV